MSAPRRIVVPADPKQGEVQLIDKPEDQMAIGVSPYDGLIVVRIGRRGKMKRFYSNLAEITAIAEATSAYVKTHKPLTSGTRRASANGSGRATTRGTESADVA